MKRRQDRWAQSVQFVVPQRQVKLWWLKQVETCLQSIEVATSVAKGDLSDSVSELNVSTDNLQKLANVPDMYMVTTRIVHVCNVVQEEEWVPSSEVARLIKLPEAPTPVRYGSEEDFSALKVHSLTHKCHVQQIGEGEELEYSIPDFWWQDNIIHAWRANFWALKYVYGVSWNGVLAEHFVCRQSATNVIIVAEGKITWRLSVCRHWPEADSD